MKMMWIVMLGALATQGMAPQPAPALDKITVAIGGYGMGETGICERGQMQGLFRKHGLELDVVYTAGPQVWRKWAAGDGIRPVQRALGLQLGLRNTAASGPFRGQKPGENVHKWEVGCGGRI